MDQEKQKPAFILRTPSVPSSWRANSWHNSLRLAISLVLSLKCPSHFLAFCSLALHVLMVVHWAVCAQSCVRATGTALLQKTMLEWVQSSCHGRENRVVWIIFYLSNKASRCDTTHPFFLESALKESFIHSRQRVLWIFIGRASWDIAGTQNCESAGKERGL